MSRKREVLNRAEVKRECKKHGVKIGDSAVHELIDRLNFTIAVAARNAKESGRTMILKRDFEVRKRY